MLLEPAWALARLKHVVKIGAGVGVIVAFAGGLIYLYVTDGENLLAVIVTALLGSIVGAVVGAMIRARHDERQRRPKPKTKKLFL
jgi:uncharacterized membrane protein YfcA